MANSEYGERIRSLEVKQEHIEKSITDVNEQVKGMRNFWFQLAKKVINKTWPAIVALAIFILIIAFLNWRFFIPNIAEREAQEAIKNEVGKGLINRIESLEGEMRAARDSARTMLNEIESTYKNLRGVEENIENLKESISNLIAQHDGLKGRYDDLDETVSSNSANINNLRQNIASSNNLVNQIERAQLGFVPHPLS